MKNKMLTLLTATMLASALLMTSASATTDPLMLSLGNLDNQNENLTATTGEQNADVSKTSELGDGTYKLEIYGNPNKLTTKKSAQIGMQNVGIAVGTTIKPISYNEINYIRHEHLFSGVNSIGALRSYIRPNHELPSNATITKIELALYTYSVEAVSVTNVYEATDVWRQDKITWANQPGFYDGIIASAATNRVNTKYVFDITALKDVWQEEGKDWSGVVLSSTSGQTKFYSSRATNASLRPVITVYYK